MAREIEITIFRDGSSKVDAKNFQGQGCAQATKAIEVALGGLDPANKSDSKKPDYFQSVTSNQTVRR